MPVYEYVCKDCGNQFDAIRSIKDADQVIACKKCQSHDTHRKISVFFAQSGGRSITSSQSSCGGCGSGSCGSCSSCGSHHN